MHLNRDKHHQIPAIVCSIREILNLSYYLSKPARDYLEEILSYFQEEIGQNKNQNDINLTTSISREQPTPFHNTDQEYEDRPMAYSYNISHGQERY